ncbi:MAG: hypothetical protein IJ429_00130 [Lachnospiraceae bacterium]|nr:hypothetical protein [Lachnospiraceae bacterium]
MKRKLVAAICIVCLVACSIFLYHRLFAYIVEYNVGNSFARNEMYASAGAEYEKALSRDVPEGKECSIRINYALCMVRSLGEDYAEPDRADVSVSVLEDARNVLLEDNCATEEGTGHSEEAEQLREEIERLLEELRQSSSGEEDEDTKQAQAEDASTKEEDIREQNIRRQLGEMQSKSFQERREEEQFMAEFDAEIVFDYDGDIW